MNDSRVLRITGVSGVAIGVASLLLVPLYFMYPGAPPEWNILTRNLLNLIVCVLLLVFIAGFADLVRRASTQSDWIPSLFYGAGVTYAAVAFVAISLEVGVVFSTSGPVDPTIHGPLAAGAILMRGSVTRALTVVLMCTAGYSISSTRVLPRWLGRAAYTLAAINLLFVPSLYFGTNAATFYSALGWGNTALVASLMAYWIMAAGVAMLRRKAPA